MNPSEFSGGLTLSGHFSINVHLNSNSRHGFLRPRFGRRLFIQKFPPDVTQDTQETLQSLLRLKIVQPIPKEQWYTVAVHGDLRQLLPGEQVAPGHEIFRHAGNSLFPDHSQHCNIHFYVPTVIHAGKFRPFSFSQLVGLPKKVI